MVFRRAKKKGRERKKNAKGGRGHRKKRAGRREERITAEESLQERAENGSVIAPKKKLKKRNTQRGTEARYMKWPEGEGPAKES